MNRNQKIALGCGGAGCLGLILIVIVCVVLLSTGYIKFPGSTNSNDNFNSSSNRNSNSNVNENSNRSSSNSSSTLSDDDKHKLFQAAGITKDSDLIQKVLVKIGFSATGGPGYEDFVKAHFPWAMKNVQFIQSVNTVEKGRAYVNAHIDD